MRVLHIHSSDGHSGGGGGIAMYRLHTRLKDAGVDSRILCLKGRPDLEDTDMLPRVDLLKVERLLRSLTSRLGLNDIHRLGSFQLTDHEFYRDADVVHFHCTHSGTFSYLAFPKVSRQKPCVFSLHDMWAFTGHCGYSYDCTRWKTGCGRCPYPRENPRIARDGTRWEWRLKRWVYGRSDMTFISKSSWTTRQVRDSVIGHLPVVEIPCGVDTDAYRPLDRDLARTLLGIPRDRYVMLFVAQSLDSRRKGADLLLAALRALPQQVRTKSLLLMLGRGGDVLGRAAGMSTVDLGYVESDRLKAVAYSAADLTLFPTRADVFGLVSIESQACGTPVVGFRVGGVPDHVRPGRTGYLAAPEDPADFRDGILQLLGDRGLRACMANRCRETVLSEYSLDLEVQRHRELYEKIISDGQPTDQDTHDRAPAARSTLAR